MATRATWAARVRDWKRSGLTANDYAEREGLKAGTLLWWSSQVASADLETAGRRGNGHGWPLGERARGDAGEWRSSHGAGGLRRGDAGATADGAGGALMLPTSMRILVCTERQDMRRSFDTLAAVVRDVMREEPQSGAL